MIRKLIAITTLMAMPFLLQAAPVDLTKISADAKWAAQVDVAAIMKSSGTTTLINFLQSQACAELVPAAELKKGVDRANKADSITVYGDVLKKGNGVLIYQGDIDMAEVTKMVESGHCETQETYNGQVIRAWKGGPNGKAYSCLADDRTAVLSAHLDQLKNALDVLAGTKPNLSGSTGFVASKMKELSSSLVSVAAAGLPQDEPYSIMLSKTSEFSFQLSEDAAGIHNVSRFVMLSDADAKMVSGFFVGLKSLAMMNASQYPAVTELANRYSIVSDGKVITADLSYTADEMSTWLGMVLESVKDLPVFKKCQAAKTNP